MVDFRIAPDGMRIKSESGIAAGAGQPHPAGVAAFCWPDSSVSCSPFSDPRAIPSCAAAFPRHAGINVVTHWAKGAPGISSRRSQPIPPDESGLGGASNGRSHLCPAWWLRSHLGFVANRYVIFPKIDSRVCANIIAVNTGLQGSGRSTGSPKVRRLRPVYPSSSASKLPIVK